MSFYRDCLTRTRIVYDESQAANRPAVDVNRAKNLRLIKHGCAGLSVYEVVLDRDAYIRADRFDAAPFAVANSAVINIDDVAGSQIQGGSNGNNIRACVDGTAHCFAFGCRNVRRIDEQRIPVSVARRFAGGFDAELGTDGQGGCSSPPEVNEYRGGYLRAHIKG